MRDGRYRLDDDGGPGRRLACRDVGSGVPADRRAAALAAGDPGQGGLPTDELAHHSLLRRLVEHVEHCEQWRGQIIARLRAEHPRLVVVSMWRGYGAGHGYAARFHVIRPGVDRRPDPPRAAAARHRCAGAGARADPGSAHSRCRSACPATSMTRRPARRQGRRR